MKRVNTWSDGYNMRQWLGGNPSSTIGFFQEVQIEYEDYALFPLFLGMSRVRQLVLRVQGGITNGLGVYEDS